MSSYVPAALIKKLKMRPICKNDDHSSLPILKNISYLEISWYLIQSLNFLPLPWLKNTQFSVNDEINFDNIFYSFREKSWRGCDFPQKLCCRRVQVNKIFALAFCFKYCSNTVRKKYHWNNLFEQWKFRTIFETEYVHTFKLILEVSTDKIHWNN